MTAGIRQGVLTVIFLGALTLVGSSFIRQDSPDPPAPGSTLALTDETTSSADPPEEATALAAGETPVALASDTPDTTVPPAPRELSVVVYPTEADVNTSATDATGASVEGGPELTARMSGPVSLTVDAPGYRSETLTVASELSGAVEIYLDPSDQVVDRTMVFTTSGAPKQVAFTPDSSELWVTLLSGTGVEVFDPRTGSLLTAIDLPEAGSVEVIFNAAGTRAYVSQMETASVYEIDVATRSILRTLNTGGSWTKVMVLSADETRLWASNWVSNDVSEFDLTTGELVRRIPTVTTPRGLALDPDGDRLYVAGFDTGDIEVVDLDTGSSETIYHSGGALRHLVADPTSPVIYASDMARDTIVAIDTITDTVTETASTDRLPNTIDISPDGRILAVSNRGRNNPETYYLPGPEWGTVLFLDIETGAILDAIVGGNQPTGLDWSDDGHWLAYSDFLDNRVTVVSMPSTSVLADAGGGRAESYRGEITK